jgi:hypothetical protein
MKMFQGIVLPVMDEAVAGDAAIGNVGAGATALTVGDTLGVGTAAAALTPRLPTCVDPNGIPVRTGLLVVVGDVDVGVDDAAMLLEPEPHIPVRPDVSSIPEDVDNPDVAEIAVDVDIPDDVDVPDGATPPDVAAVAGVEIPVAIPIPPPS